MILQSLSASSLAAPPANFPRISRCKWSSFRYSRDQNSRTSLSTRKYVGFVFSNNRFHRKGNLNVFASSNSENGGGSATGNPNVDSKVANLTTRGTKSIVIKRFSKELDGNNGDPLTREHLQLGSGGSFARFREDPIVDKLRTQLGVIHPLPSPRISRSILGLFVLFFFVGVGFDKVWTRVKRLRLEREALIRPQVPTNFSAFSEKDLQRKESVEWVNMVLGKLWKVYRGGLENWIVGLLQPVIDDLKKPDYVQRVEVKQFSLGDEPLSVRSVERRTSRRANDLQYQIGLRYTGGARMLLMLSLKLGIVPVVVPVDVRDFDIDGELWVKVRLIPTEPWVGGVSWAFVALPKIKFELSAFRLFNLMGKLQDFQMLVSNPRKQKLFVQVKDSFWFADVTIGATEIDLGSLEDTVPTDRVAALKGGWGLFRKGKCGEVLLRLTYKAYVEDEEDNASLEGMKKETIMDVLAALLVSEEFQGIVSSEDDKTTTASAQSTSSKPESDNGVSNGSVLFWLSIVTAVAFLIGVSSLFHP